MNNTNTVVYVKVKGNRPAGFVDPSPFEWNVEKEKQLWSMMSKLDNYQDQIDWKDLSKTLEAPDYFLKRRSYKLFAMHLKLLEQQIERKMMANNDNEGSRQTSIRQFEPIIETHTLTESAMKDQNSHEESSIDEGEEATFKALQQLHTSKILNQSKLPATEGKELRKTGSANNANVSDSETSSSLSVSTSALEEALMDRLQL